MCLQVGMLINSLRLISCWGLFLPIPSPPRSTPTSKSVIMFRVKWSKGKVRPLPPRQQLLAAFRQRGHKTGRPWRITLSLHARLATPGLHYYTGWTRWCNTEHKFVLSQMGGDQGHVGVWGDSLFQAKVGMLYSHRSVRNVRMGFAQLLAAVTHCF